MVKITQKVYTRFSTTLLFKPLVFLQTDKQQNEFINFRKWTLFLVSFISIAIGNLNAQTWKTPTQVGGNYVPANYGGIYFLSSTQGWAVGNNGTILVTNNGGTTWTAQTSGTTFGLASVYFSSSTQGWAVGQNGIILVTNNGGTTWTAQTSGTTQLLTKVKFVSNTQGWVIGFNGTILFTNNGGTTWTAQTSGTTVGLQDLSFISSTQGWVAGNNGTILVTSNGGTTWTAQTSGTNLGLGSVYFASSTHGWAVGSNGTIRVTSNGGLTWTAQTSGVNLGLEGVYFTSSTQGWVVGSNGTILVTSNGGTTWTAQTSGTLNPFYGVQFISATQGWVIGASGTLLVTNNGGTTWTPQTFGTLQNLNSVYFTSATQGWAAGNAGNIIVTNNGGLAWSAQTSGTNQLLNSIHFVSATQGWAVGNNGVILTTSNGGTTWTAQTSGTSLSLQEVYFTSATQGWVVGTSGIILVTSNGGITWTTQTSGTTNSLQSIHFISATQGWIVGASGIILVTNNGGTTWTTQTTGIIQNLNSVYFTSSTQGWAVGNVGTILVTNNGGATWTVQATSTTLSLNSVYFTSSTQGKVIGNSGSIFTTSNGGTTWTTETVGNSNTLQSVKMIGSTKGWAVGNGGTILLYGATAPSTVAPSVSTNGATIVGSNNATLGGNVTDSGSALVSERGIVYATTLNPTTANTKVQIGSGIGAYSQNITGLTASTTYHVRAYAINSVGTSYGADSTFTTLASSPNPLANNTLSGDQSYCSVAQRDSIFGSLPTGGSEPITYLWQYSLSSAISGFGALPNNTGRNLMPVTNLGNSWYRRIVISGSLRDTSLVTKITINRVNNDSIYGPNEVCASTTSLPLRTGINTLIGVSSYSWLRSTTDSLTGFSTAPGTSNQVNYSPGTVNQTAWYRVIATSGNCKDTTKAFAQRPSNSPNSIIPGPSGPTSAQGGPVVASAFQRGISIYPASEIQDVLNIGDSISKIGWVISSISGTAFSQPVSGQLKIYLVNTNDASMLRATSSTNWSTIISTPSNMTLCYDSAFSLPTVAGPYFVRLQNKLAYAGQGIYLAFEWVPSSTTSTSTINYGLNLNVSNGTFNGTSNSALPITLSGTILRPRIVIGTNCSVAPPPASLATVLTLGASLVSSSSATLGGNVTANGGANVNERGVVYATSSNPTISTGTKVIIGAGNGTYSQNITGLTASTTYHVRAYAINSVGTSYGADSTFITTSVPSIAPTVSTTSPSLIGITNATLGGNVSDSGTATVSERGIVYATTANPTTSNTKVQIGSGIGSFSQNITGLTASTTYHVRAYAINSVGTSYGADSTFTTTSVPSIAPTVSTASASLIGINNATLGGNVSDSGTATVSERGIVYATTANPTTSNTKVQIGSGIGSFSQNITGLTASTTYHVRAYAINSVGTSYGADSTFTTSASTPVAGLSIASYMPQSGNVGSTVTIKGTSFVNVTKVWFGAAPAASFTVVNDSTINAVVPDNAYMGNIAVATNDGFKIGKEYFYVKNPQNVMFGNSAQTGVYFLKDGKLYGQYIYYFDDGQSYRYCPVEMPPKGSLRGKTISQLSTSGTWGLIALASDNTVHTQGNNNFRQLGDSSTVSVSALPVNITNKGDLNGKTVIQVLAGYNRFYALTSDGTVCSWGKDTLGSLGNGASTNGMVWTPTSIASKGSLVGKTIIKLCKGTDANIENNVFAIASDGTVHGWGPNKNSSIGVTHNNVIEDPVQITQSGVLNGKTIVDIDSKNTSTILLDEDGILYGMGTSMNLGLSGASTRNTPDLLNMGSTSSLNNKRVLSMVMNRTSGSAIVVDTAGKVHAIGNNASAHLGTGNSNNAIPPVLVEATSSSIAGKVVVGLAQTNYAYYVTTSDNQMHVFGNAGSYQLLNGLSTPNAAIPQLIGNPKPLPLLDATNLVFSNITGSSATIKCTAGSGVGRMIVVKANTIIDTIGPAHGVNYSPSTNLFGSQIDTTGRVVYKGFGDSVNITNLVNGTLYHVSVFEFDTFSNPCKYDVFKLGTPLMGSFIATSGPQLATVRTSSATSITVNSATLGGNIAADGGSAVTERGIVYATTINPTTSNTKVQIGSGIGAYSQNITGLTAATTYHVRAYAINSVGTSYGADSTFTTDFIPPPTLSLIASFDPFVTCVGAASSPQQFTVSGVNLTGNITVSAPTGFEISTTMTSGFASSLILTATSGTVSATTLYIRISGSATGTPSGNLSVSSNGATTQNQNINATLNPVPASPVISIQAASPVCKGAQYLNFGASTAPASGVSYQWSATNANLYAQGSTKQYSLISFPNAGAAVVTLTASQNGCSSSTSVDINVNAEQAPTATVRYFNKNFVCEANKVQKYQWGYDDLPSLKGNIIQNEINQNYYNASPETATKAYWVISNTGNCYQKTYHAVPLSTTELLANELGLEVYPNPFSSQINIRSSRNLKQASIKVLDLNGRSLSTEFMNGSDFIMNLDGLAAGIYLLHVEDENGLVSTTKIIKH